MPNSSPIIFSSINIRKSAARRWLSVALFGLCALDSNLARADAPASAAVPAQQASAPTLIQLPKAPDTTPSPWVPYAIERGMGAKCEGVDIPPPVGYEESERYRGVEFFPAGICKGPIPARLARMIEALPDDLFHKAPTSATLRHKALHTESSAYLAAPGRGQRPDFLVNFGGLYIKTLEGPNPDVTVAAVWRYRCIPDPKYSGSNSSYCSLIPNPRIFRFTGNMPPREVTTALWPEQPVITPRQQAYLDQHGANLEIFLIVSKLAYAPTVAWHIEFDPSDFDSKHTPLPRNWADDHIGFVTWTGTRFERRLTVPRRLWPCAPVPNNAVPCSEENSWLKPIQKYVTP